MLSDDKSLRLFACAAFAAAVVAVAIGSLVPGQPAPDGHPWADKLLHFSAYFSLGFLGCAAMPRYWYVLMVLVPLLGLGLELRQILVPGRDFDWLDLAANTAGAAIGIVFSRIRFPARAGRSA